MTMPAIFPIRLTACPAATVRWGDVATIQTYPVRNVARIVQVTGGKGLADNLRLAIARFGADVLEANPGRSFIVSASIPRPHRKPPGFDALVRDSSLTGGNQWLREGEGPWFTSEDMVQPAAPAPSPEQAHHAAAMEGATYG
jgi:hypothetical protein